MWSKVQKIAGSGAAVARTIRQDIEAVRRHDPAAQNTLEIVLTYPGVHAIWMHRVAHRLWKRGAPLTARLLSSGNRFLTGIEIHPGARVGQGVFIDHGMGVVIGETATVGDGCVLFKGVVLGGTQARRCVRHPQLGREVIVGSNACILGNIQVGDGARIGSGSVVVHPVPSEATVVGIPGRVVVRGHDKRARFEAFLDHASLPDPVQSMLRSLRDENEQLRQRVAVLENHLHLEAARETLEERHLVDAAEATPDLPDLPDQHGG